ncbi:MAG: succinate dehydrogenase [Desulfobacca sp.]|uniref:succinate dehydrogenase n=1 Tax=Desulfobacca sp. TaxID=2067990 RepID=UPI00404B9080
MYVQKTLTKTPRGEAWMELLEMISGLFLALFIQVHILAVSNILFGAAAFDQKSEQMDEYFISHIAIFLVCVAILGHGLLALRKAPWRVQEAQIVWRHSKLLRHDETWYWLIQIVTGLAVLILAVIHIAGVLTDWPIQAVKSAARVQSGGFIFYLILIGIAQLHAFLGIYRIFIKWGWWPRKPILKYLAYTAIAFSTFGVFTLFVFLLFISAGGA